MSLSTLPLARLTLPFLLLLFCIYACRKTDKALQVPPTSIQDYTQIKKQFFNANAADPEVQKLAADIQKGDSLCKSLPEFVRKNGTPNWDKTLYKLKSSTGTLGSTMQRSISDTSGQGLFFVPLQAQNSTQVLAYIAAYKTSDTTYSYKLFNKDSLIAITPQNSETKRAIVMALGVLAYFEKSINNQQSSQYALSSTESVQFRNPNIVITETAVTPGGKSTNSSLTSHTLDCNFSLTITETYSEINIYVNGQMVYHYESYSMSVVTTLSGDCGGAGDTPWGSPVGTGWYNWGTGYNYDPLWNNYSYSGWLYPWWMYFVGGSGSVGGFGFPYDFNFFNLYNFEGTKPLAEYSDTAKCQGVQDIWNNYPVNEVMAFVTSEGKLIVTQVLPLTGGSVNGLYTHNNPATGAPTYYYIYPMSSGAPSQNYAGMVNNGQYYFIPIVASVHTHAPCRTDGTNGVSHPVGSDDQALATSHSGLRHFVIGCGAVAQYNSSNPNFYNVQIGLLSSTCNLIN